MAVAAVSVGLFKDVVVAVAAFDHVSTEQSRKTTSTTTTITNVLSSPFELQFSGSISAFPSQSCLGNVAPCAHVASPTLATVYKSCAVLSCAARISSYGCIRVTSCCEHQRGVIFKPAWSCRRALLDHLRTQFGAVNAISRLASLHPESHFRER